MEEHIFKKIPLAKILKGKFFRIAEMQDTVILELIKNFDFVLHGGTAIWRIYKGKRFSFDIDIYHKRPEKITEYFLSQKNFTVVKKKITPSKVLYLKLRDIEEIELEVSPFFKKIKPIDADFWLIDGSTIVVKTLSPEDLIKEKIQAFLNRKKVRDLYDIYYLLDFCKINRIKNELNILAKNLSKPKDFSGLKELVILGRAPSFDTIASKVKKYAGEKI